MKPTKLFLTLLLIGLGLLALGSVSGCSKSAVGAAPLLVSANSESNALAQRVPIDVGAFKSRVEMTLLSRQGAQAELVLTDGRTLQVPVGLLPPGASVGGTYILSLALTDPASSPSFIERWESSGTSEIVTAQGRVSLPTSILPSQARQQGHLALTLFDNPRPLQAISFDARVTQVSPETVVVRGEPGGATFELPRTLWRYPELQAGDLYRVTLTSTNEPDDDWSGTVARRDRDFWILALKTAGREVRYPSIYAPQTVREGDFFALTLVKIYYQPGDLTQS